LRGQITKKKGGCTKGGKKGGKWKSCLSRSYRGRVEFVLQKGGETKHGEDRGKVPMVHWVGREREKPEVGHNDHHQPLAI